MTIPPGPTRYRVSHPPALSRILLGFALVVGMTSWLVHLIGSSILVPAACAHDLQWTINVLTVITAVVCAGGIPAGLVIHRRYSSGDDARSQAYRMLAYVAVASNSISLLLILAEGVPNLVLGPCP